MPRSQLGLGAYRCTGNSPEDACHTGRSARRGGAGSPWAPRRKGTRLAASTSLLLRDPENHPKGASCRAVGCEQARHAGARSAARGWSQAGGRSSGSLPSHHARLRPEEAGNHGSAGRAALRGSAWWHSIEALRHVRYRPPGRSLASLRRAAQVPGWIRHMRSSMESVVCRSFPVRFLIEQ